MQNRHNNIVFHLIFSGIMLSLAIVLDYLSKFMVLVPHLIEINISIIPILFTFIFVNWKYGSILLILRFLFSLIWSNMPFPISLWGSFIGLLASFVYIMILFLFKKIKFIKKTKNKITIIWIILISILSSLIMATFNAFCGIPIYIFLVTNTFSFHINSIWGIKNYFAIVYTIYLVGNLIIYSITSFAYICFNEIFINKK